MVNKEDKNVSISELANQFSTSRDSIEIYGLNKLVSPKPKNPSSKVYGPLDQTRLKFILHAKNADYSINNIRILIGELDFEKDETEQIEDSFIYSKKQLNQIQSSLQDLDMLEQINVTCDIELLNAYINDLNQLKYGLHESPSNDRWLRSGEIDKTKSKNLLYSKIISDDPVHIQTGQLKNSQKKTVSKFLYVIPAILIILISGYVFFEPTAILDRLFDTPVVVEPEIVETNSESTSTSTDDSFQSANEDLNTNPANQKSTFKSIGADKELPMDARSPISDPQRLSAILYKYNSGDMVRKGIEEFNKDYDTKTADEIETTKLSSAPKSQIELEEELFDSLINSMSAKYDRETSGQSTLKDRLEKYISDSKKNKGKDQTSKADSLATLPGNSSGNNSKKKNTGVASEKINKVTTQNKTSIKKKPQESRTKATSLKSKQVSPTPKTRKKPVNTAVKSPSARSSKTSSPVIPPKPQVKKAASSTSKAIIPKKTKPQTAPPKPANPEALKWTQKSYESVMKGDAGEAIITASVALTLDPGMVNAYINRSWAYSKKGQYDKAIQDCDKALNLDNKNALAFNNRGLAFQGKGDMQRAKTDYERSCQLGFDIGCKNYQEVIGEMADNS